MIVIKYPGARETDKRRDRIVITKYGSSGAFTITATGNIELIKSSVRCNWSAFRREQGEISFSNILSYARFIIDILLCRRQHAAEKDVKESFK